MGIPPSETKYMGGTFYRTLLRPAMMYDFQAQHELFRTIFTSGTSHTVNSSTRAIFGPYTLRGVAIKKGSSRACKLGVISNVSTFEDLSTHMTYTTRCFFASSHHTHGIETKHCSYIVENTQEKSFML